MNTSLKGFAMAVVLKVRHSDWLATMLQHRVRTMHGFVQESCSPGLCVARPGLDVRYSRTGDPDESSDHSSAFADHSASSLICCDTSNILIETSKLPFRTNENPAARNSARGHEVCCSTCEGGA